jgi:hypothetical protein
MKRLVVASIAAVALAGAAAFLAISHTHPSEPRESLANGRLPFGYRDWKLISVAHEQGTLNDLRAVLGNDIAMQAYRGGTHPFPDGTIIARLAWRITPSEENNKAFGREQSFVAGAPVNGIQFMVKDARKYASTGGWGFTQFNDAKPAGNATHSTCFSCHAPAAARDFVFTLYAP